MLVSSRGFVAMKSLLFVLLSLHGGSSGLPVGPRTPDAASGSSVDGSVYSHRDGEGIHGGEAGASRYFHMGQDPRPATVDGSPFSETEVKVLVSSDEVFPKPASPGFARQRHLLWFGWGGGDKDEKENQNEAGEKKELQEGPDQQEENTGEKATMDGEGMQRDGEEKDDDLNDADHIWHDDDHDEPNASEEDDGDQTGDEDENEDEDWEDNGDVRVGADDDHHDNNQPINADNGIIYTHGKILKVAKNLLNEYQLKSLNIKEDLTDVKEREKAADRLESDIDTEIDLLMKRAQDTDAAHIAEEGNGEIKKQEFLERMMNAKKAAKKRVNDILTGHNIHFDKDDL